MRHGAKEHLPTMTNTAELLELILALPREERETLLTEAIARSGLYDSGLAGPTGESIAITQYGMTKAPKGAKGYDGIINGRRVSVKTKEPTKRNDARQYVVIRQPELADDLLLIQLHVDGTHTATMAPIAQIKFSPHEQGPRYTAKNIKAAALEVSNT